MKDTGYRAAPKLDCGECKSVGRFVGGFYEAGRRMEERTLLVMLIAATPTTIAMMLIRSSRAQATAEGDTSTECLTLRGVKATACLTPTSDTSMDSFYELAVHHLTQ